MAMAIERTNSFHLLLSNDELALLKLLAEREGLNASDFLRASIRRAASAPSHLTQAMRIVELLGPDTWAKLEPSPARSPKRKPKTK